MNPIGIFGGTFDPIHFGHLRTAFELWQVLRLAEVRFAARRQPAASRAQLADAELRLAMVRAAVAEQPRFVVDDREVRRTGPSYSVDTLTELRRRTRSARCACCSGMDAFLGLPHWHRWREILRLWRTSWSRTGPAGARRPQARSAKSWWIAAPAASATCTAGRRAHLRACRHAAGDLLDRAARAADRGPRPAVPGARRGARDHPQDRVLCSDAGSPGPLMCPSAGVPAKPHDHAANACAPLLERASPLEQTVTRRSRT